MPTKENLMAAFAGESQANRKYLAFAKQADRDGFKQVARLFRAAAEAEAVHAHAIIGAANGVKTTKENLAEAIAGEHYEFTGMYPGFLKEAAAEGNKPAETTFKSANAVEKIHHELYTQALNAVNAAKDLPPSEIHVCSVCGNTVIGEAPDRCPVCGAPKNKFFAVQ